MPPVRFAEGEGVGSGDRVEMVVQAQQVEQPVRETEALVGADGDFGATGPGAQHRRDGAGVGLAEVCEMRLIVIEEQSHQTVVLGTLRQGARIAEAALDHRPRAIADQVLDPVEGNVRPPLVPQQPADGAVEVRGAVDQGAIKIKNQCPIR